MIRIYSVGVWNRARKCGQWDNSKLEFTPLEFETDNEKPGILHARLEFTPLEFETVLESAASGITQN